MTAPVCPRLAEACISGTRGTLASELPGSSPACQKLTAPTTLQILWHMLHDLMWYHFSLLAARLPRQASQDCFQRFFWYLNDDIAKWQTPSPNHYHHLPKALHITCTPSKTRRQSSQLFGPVSSSVKNALRSCDVTTYLLQFHCNSAANCVFHHLASFNVSTCIKQVLNYQNTSYF